MSKLTDKLKKDMLNNSYNESQIENIMKENDYIIVETDDEENEKEENNETILKYTNGRSQIWIYCVLFENEEYKINNITLSNKKSGSTEVSPLRNVDDIFNLIKYFKEKGDIHHYTIFIVQLSMARRINDTVNLKWSDIFEENGRFKQRLMTLREEKTGKIIAPYINNSTKKALTEYIEWCKIDPMKHYNDKMFYVCSATFRKALKEAVVNCDIKYPVSTHSIRKTYGYWTKELHKTDIDCLEVLKSFYGHDSVETTKKYIGQYAEKNEQYSNDMSNFIECVQKGENFEINNSPCVTLDTKLLREIIINSINRTKNGDNEIDILNQCLNVIEENKK